MCSLQVKLTLFDMDLIKKFINLNQQLVVNKSLVEDL